MTISNFEDTYKVGDFIKVQIPGRYAKGGYESQILSIGEKSITVKVHEPGVGVVTLDEPIVLDMS